MSEEGEGWDREIRGLTVAQGQNWKALKAIPHKVLKLRAPNCKIVNAGGPFKGDEGYNSNSTVSHRGHLPLMASSEKQRNFSRLHQKNNAFTMC